MPAYVMSLDSNAVMSRNEYYLWYKGMYIKYKKNINPHTQKPDFHHTDSFFSVSYGQEADIWMRMAEFARAWAYANDIQIRVIPGMISSVASERQIRTLNYQFCHLRTLAQWKGFPDGMEFSYVTKIDTEEQATLLKLFTTADASPDLYLKILFFWHTLVYPSTDDYVAARYINEHISQFDEISNYIATLHDGTFGNVKNDDIGLYILQHIRHALAHIKRNSGISLIVDDIRQIHHLDAVTKILKIIAKYKLDNDFSLNQNASFDTFHMFQPEIKFP